MSLKWSKIEPTNALDAILYETSTNTIRHGFVEIGEEKTVMPIHFVNIAEKCENFEVRDSDVIIASYPKTGTTWTQEMVWMIVNNLDFEGGKQNLDARFAFLEFSGLFTYIDAVQIDPDLKLPNHMVDSIKYIEKNEETTRLIKTHLPWCLLPKQIKNKEKTPKMIYITRSAKDTFISYYYHCILLEGFTGDLETFLELFLANRLNYGNYYNHILGYWNQKHLSNILYIKYEDMKQDLSSVIIKVASFLNKSLSDYQISVLVEHLSFKNMKNNPAINYSPEEQRKFYRNNADGIEFLRSGIVGSYKKDMSEEIEKKFDKWIEENVKRTGIEFY